MTQLQPRAERVPTVAPALPGGRLKQLNVTEAKQPIMAFLQLIVLVRSSNYGRDSVRRQLAWATIHDGVRLEHYFSAGQAAHLRGADSEGTVLFTDGS
eukprot:3872874-Rhodomonas_salina.2